MTQPTIDATEAAPQVPDKGVFARVAGILFSPRETFAAIAARPRPLAMLVIILLLTTVPTGWFMSTAVGRQAMLDKAEQGMKMFAAWIPADQMAQQQEKLSQTYLEGSIWRVAGWPVASIIVVTPIIAAIYAGLLFFVFKVLLAGEGTFKQVYAVVVHSWVITGLAAVFLTPLNYVRESMDSATTLRVFLPMLDDNGFVASLLGSIDLFRIWWVVVLSIGLGVLYKRKTASIAVSLFAVYAVIALGYATIAAMFAARS